MKLPSSNNYWSDYLSYATRAMSHNNPQDNLQDNTQVPKTETETNNSKQLLKHHILYLIDNKIIY